MVGALAVWRRMSAHGDPACRGESVSLAATTVPAPPTIRSVCVRTLVTRSRRFTCCRSIPTSRNAGIPAIRQIMPSVPLGDHVELRRSDTSQPSPTKSVGWTASSCRSKGDHPTVAASATTLEGTRRHAYQRCEHCVRTGSANTLLAPVASFAASSLTRARRLRAQLCGNILVGKETLLRG